jgi:hypothetical protein
VAQDGRNIAESIFTVLESAKERATAEPRNVFASIPNPKTKHCRRVFDLRREDRVKVAEKYGIGALRICDPTKAEERVHSVHKWKGDDDRDLIGGDD